VLYLELELDLTVGFLLSDAIILLCDLRSSQHLTAVQCPISISRRLHTLCTLYVDCRVIYSGPLPQCACVRVPVTVHT
jgi:hypothetical protein